MISTASEFKIAINTVRLVFVVFVVGASCFFTTTPVYAVDSEHHIHVDFSFGSQSIPGKQLAGFRLYKDGELACETDLVEPQNIDCDIISPGGRFAFTLAAFYDDNSESPHSAPFYYILVDQSMAVSGLLLLTGENPEEVEYLGSLAGSSSFDLADVIHILRNLSSR